MCSSATSNSRTFDVHSEAGLLQPVSPESLFILRVSVISMLALAWYSILAILSLVRNV